MTLETTLLTSMFTPEASFDKKKDILFPVSLKVDMVENGGVCELKSFYEAGVFAYGEMKAWQKIIGKTHADSPFVQKIIDRQFQASASVHEMAEKALGNSISTTEAMVVIRHELNTYLTYKTLHSEGTLGRLALIMYRYEPMILGLLAGASGSQDLAEAGKALESSDLESFALGYGLTLQFQTTLHPDNVEGRISETSRKINAMIRRLETAEKQLRPIEEEHGFLQKGLAESAASLQTYRIDAESCLSKLVVDTKQTSDRAINEMWSHLNLIQTDHETKLASLRQNVSSRIRYGSALDYWNAQLLMNQAKVNQTTAWFVISGLFFIIAVLAIAFGISRTAMTGSTFVTVATMGLPIIIASGLTVMLVQTRSRYEALAVQATQKVSLLETLASLETENKVHESERAAVLQAIFESAPSKPTARDKPEESKSENQDKKE